MAGKTLGAGGNLPAALVLLPVSASVLPLALCFEAFDFVGVVLDYQRYRNIQADTSMRRSIAGEDTRGQSQ